MFDYATITVKGRESMADMRARLVGQPCRLDHKDATIKGRLLPYAHVVTLDGAQDVEYSWAAVSRIMARDRIFSS